VVGRALLEHAEAAARDAGGKKAFEEKPERRALKLKESRVVGDGVLVLIYERAS